MIRAVIFDFGQTIVPEDTWTPRADSAMLMPGVIEALSSIDVSKGIWANTRNTDSDMIRAWLKGAGIEEYIKWIVTSFEIGHRKPDFQFFRCALDRCGLLPTEVLLVGNPLNTDIAGGNAAGIKTVYLADPVYRSADDRRTNAIPTYVIDTLYQLPALVHELMR